MTSAQRLSPENRAYLRDVLVPNLNAELDHVTLEYTISNSKAGVLIYTDVASALRAGIKKAETTGSWASYYRYRKDNKRLNSFKLFIKQNSIARSIDLMGPGDMSGRLTNGLLAAVGFPQSSQAVKARRLTKGTVDIHDGVAKIMSCQSLPTRTQAHRVLKLLRKGDKEATRRVQQALKNLGYKPGPVDGAYGRKTHDAIKTYLIDHRAFIMRPWITKDLINYMAAKRHLEGEVFDDPLGLQVLKARKAPKIDREAPPQRAPSETKPVVSKPKPNEPKVDLSWRQQGKTSCDQSFSLISSFFRTYYGMDKVADQSRSYVLKSLPVSDQKIQDYKSSLIKVAFVGEIKNEVRMLAETQILPRFSKSTGLFKFQLTQSPIDADVIVLFGDVQLAKTYGLTLEHSTLSSRKAIHIGSRSPKHIVWFSSALTDGSKVQTKAISRALAQALGFSKPAIALKSERATAGNAIHTLKPELADMLACSYAMSLNTPSKQLSIFRKGSREDRKFVAQALKDLGYEVDDTAIEFGQYSRSLFNAVEAYSDKNDLPAWVTPQLVDVLKKGD